ncbi:hypothetical protein [Streptomyces sp. NPDC059979]|uniref:hypothetical protein n=1 Tax=Streptomyces sp. NPDC059979 TaxID=3347021 RepID=UPI0036AD2442
MKNTRAVIAAASAAAVVSLTACLSDPKEEARVAVDQGCTDMGYTVDRQPAPPSGEMDSQDWMNLATRYNDISNKIAKASRQDPAWSALSNAVNDFQNVLVKTSHATDKSLTPAKQDVYWDEINRLDSKAMVTVISQECRKAQA